jgi:hypothetical protein
MYWYFQKGEIIVTTSEVIAPKGAVWVCQACGRRSKDRYGYKRISSGWDESCMINAVLCKKDSLEFKGNIVIKADPWKEDKL